MKKTQIAAQLYSFRDYIKTPGDIKKTLRRIKQIGYDAVQLSSSLAPMPEEDLVMMLADEGLAAPTAHEPSGTIVDDTASVIAHLQKLKCAHVAYPFPHKVPQNAAEAAELGRTLNKAANTMTESGITLAYHNHDIEFLRFDERTMLDIIFENAPALQAEIDTFWVQSGGANPVDWIQKMNHRMDVLHIKDYAVVSNNGVRRIMAPIGQGNLNWQTIIPAAENAGVRWFVVEHDGDCADPFESFRISMEYLTAHFVR